MAGLLLSILPMRRYDFTSLQNGQSNSRIVAQRIDISQYITGILIVRVHAADCAGGIIEPELIQDGYTPEDPARTFQEPDPYFSEGTLIDSSTVAPVLLAGATGGPDSFAGEFAALKISGTRTSSNPALRIKATISADLLLRSPDDTDEFLAAVAMGNVHDCGCGQNPTTYSFAPPDPPPSPSSMGTPSPSSGPSIGALGAARGMRPRNESLDESASYWPEADARSADESESLSWPSAGGNLERARSGSAGADWLGQSRSVSSSDEPDESTANLGPSSLGDETPQVLQESSERAPEDEQPAPVPLHSPRVAASQVTSGAAQRLTESTRRRGTRPTPNDAQLIDVSQWLQHASGNVDVKSKVLAYSSDGVARAVIPASRGLRAPLFGPGQQPLDAGSLRRTPQLSSDGGSGVTSQARLAFAIRKKPGGFGVRMKSRGTDESFSQYAVKSFSLVDLFNAAESAWEDAQGDSIWAQMLQKIRNRTIVPRGVLASPERMMVHYKGNLEAPVQNVTLFGTPVMTAPPWRPQCSGTLIGPRSVLLSAHCVVNEDTGVWADVLNGTSIVTPARSGNYWPFGVARVVNAFVHPLYKASDTSGSIDIDSVSEGHLRASTKDDYDYALLTLDRPVGDVTGYIDLTWDMARDDMLSDGTRFSLRGYPEEDSVRMYLSRDRARTVYSRTFNHHAIASGGQSGSSLIFDNPPAGGLLGGIHKGNQYAFEDVPPELPPVERITGIALIKALDTNDEVAVRITSPTRNDVRSNLITWKQMDEIRAAAGILPTLPQSQRLWTWMGDPTKGWSGPYEAPAVVTQAPDTSGTSTYHHVFTRHPITGRVFWKYGDATRYYYPSREGWEDLGVQPFIGFRVDPAWGVCSGNPIKCLFAPSDLMSIRDRWMPPHGGVAAVSRTPGTLDIFVKAASGDIWWRGAQGVDPTTAPKGNWGEWRSIGSAGWTWGPPTAVATGPNEMYVFAFGIDPTTLSFEPPYYPNRLELALYMKRWSRPATAGSLPPWVGGQWDPWQKIIGNVAKYPEFHDYRHWKVAAISRSGGVDVFARTGKGFIFHLRYVGRGRQVFQAVPGKGKAADQPAAVAVGPNAMAVVVRGIDDDNRVYTQTWSSSTWSGSWNLVRYIGNNVPPPPKIITTPAVCSRGAGSVDVFAPDFDGNVLWISTGNFAGNVWNISARGRGSAFEVSATAVGGRAFVLARGTDNGIYRRFLDVSGRWEGEADPQAAGGRPRRP